MPTLRTCTHIYETGQVSPADRTLTIQRSFHTPLYMTLVEIIKMPGSPLLKVLMHYFNSKLLFEDYVVKMWCTMALMGLFSTDLLYSRLWTMVSADHPTLGGRLCV